MIHDTSHCRFRSDVANCLTRGGLVETCYVLSRFDPVLAKARIALLVCWSYYLVV